MQLGILDQASTRELTSWDAALTRTDQNSAETAGHAADWPADRSRLDDTTTITAQFLIHAEGGTFGDQQRQVR